MKRIAITGSSGSGKSTLAKEIAEALGLPLIHMDKHFWKPNWVRPGKEEWREVVQKLASGDAWVMDGNYGSTFDVRFPRATHIIHMDFSRYRCLYRILKRRVLTGKVERNDMAEGCYERFDLEFCKYVLDYPKVYGPRVYQTVDSHGLRDRLTVLRTPKDVRDFLQNISNFEVEKNSK